MLIQTKGTLGTEYGGTCTASCSGNHTLISLSPTTWTFYQIPFSQLLNGTVPFNAQDALTIEFLVYSATSTEFTANFWIDDLTFF